MTRIISSAVMQVINSRVKALTESMAAQQLAVQAQAQGLASLKDDLLSVAGFAAAGDSDQDVVERAVAYAYANGKSLLWPKIFESTRSIPNLHDVTHYGPGGIRRGQDVFHVAPNGAELSVIYVGTGGLNANDGLSPAQPTTIAKALERMLALGPRASDGQWRVQWLDGTYNSGGQTFYNCPYFTRPLQIWGARDASGNASVIWDGATSTPKYAFRADGNSAALHVHFKHIKFKNWSGDPSNAGAIVCWQEVNAMTEECEFEACTVAVWCRGGWSRHRGDKIVGPGAWGYGFQYSHSAQVGTSMQPCTISGVGIGVFCARESVAHVDYTTMTGNTVNFQLHQKSRIATVGSSFSSWSDVSIWMQGDSIYEDSTEVPSTINPASVTDVTPLYRLDNGSSVPAVHFGPLAYRTQHYCPASSYNLTGTTAMTNLSAQAGFGAPLRMPKNMLFNSGTLQIRMEFRVDVGGANGTKKVSLYGPGVSAAYEIGSIDIPAGGGLGKLHIELDFRPNGTSLLCMRYECSNPALDVKRFTVVPSGTIGVLRDGTSDLSLWRLYGTLSNAADNLALSSMTTYVMG